MDDYKGLERRAPDPEINRTATLLELKILSQDANHKIDILNEKISSVLISVSEVRVQVTTNTQEIATLRDHYHDIAGDMTMVKGKSEILSTDSRRELARLLPDLREIQALLRRRGLTDVPTMVELVWLQDAARELGSDGIETLRANVHRQQERDLRWFGMSREVILIVSGGIFVLANSPFLERIWHAFAGG